MRAWLNLRYAVPSRRHAFEQGLRSVGFEIKEDVSGTPKRGDVLVTWNRIGSGHTLALAFERRRLPVIVVENASWGNSFAGRRWYHLARNRHNTAGRFPIGGPERWDDLGVELAPFRTEGDTVLLPQRGIGAYPTRMPNRWIGRSVAKYGGRVRKHPGRRPAVDLDEDLANAGRVVTWGSGAAIKALIAGIPVTSEMPNWIGEQDNTSEGRLAMFRRLAWAQWTINEISAGTPFERLIHG